ncbi:LytR family transcriptional regulator [Bacillus atrophaeus]|uniref:Polyisoprenyl-teichoic acid--peptidoglycan teichoic acid transferase TagU n=1 Tax=Bacillus atrophaeus (strain 1942) TaxID=720555 RepID=A0ABM5M1T4_BACA1|nr:LytR family transcriptional regulator [Bacillus atrophaeus]AMR61248.1 trascriptional regulator [Bacillus subtilis subsp. globigii]ADP34064.1 membrane-bound transcriptional regulator LytR [Bacillus atrophaeus 1942]AIK45995.1 transcriptional regulator lytR [Bacillus atrophaeus subsp. globigii]EIM10920.1 membrane-bound transcriptional regulator LytR [Bacillus atrophaeus C89]KFK82858.1 transcriptional regulator lytR [Bacillus atrophaeus]
MRAERRKKKKKVLLIVLMIIGLFVLATGGYAYYLWNKAASTVASIQEDLKKSDKRDKDIDISKKDPISVLIMGVDERKNDKGRADTLIYMTVNPKTKTTEMVSIPRDTYTKIVGKGTMDKINHSYAYGGTQMAADTVEELLDVPVDYFVKVNMESFKDTVDKLGGITVNSTFAFSYDGHSFGTGNINLNGEEALAYTRMRKEDPKGDFGRQQRQRQVIEGIISKGANISSITKFGDMFKVVEDNMKTNMSFDDMWTIMTDYKKARNKVIQHELKGSGTKINNIYYYQLDETSLASVKKELKESLE